MSTAEFDVVIIGAGLSGISAAYHLQKACPNKTFTIIERREQIGGTWDLFRYPGVRSDSDMFTLGYSFKPWPSNKAIAPGESIRNYVQETASENGIDSHIQFQRSLLSSSWSSEDARWTLDIKNESDGSTSELKANFVMSCAGYYNYEKAYTPDFKGTKDFKGEIIHPQFWPEHLDYSDKKVVVIGSGATAITLVPAMADKAAHVTMLQRSPTYMVSLPSENRFANMLRRNLPKKLAYTIARLQNVLLTASFFKLSRSRPQLVKRLLLKGVGMQLKDKSLVKQHFTPSYDPWDERLCAVTDADMFKGINKGAISVVTDQVDCFTSEGIKLQSGEVLEADIIITATGLELRNPSTTPVYVDGVLINASEKVNYKGLMINDVPNMSQTFGYTNASWTLKADLIHSYVCRLLNYMDRKDKQFCVPRLQDAGLELENALDLQSGYVQRSIHLLPKQGKYKPWKLYQNYLIDYLFLKRGSLNDGVMEFKNSGEFFLDEAANSVNVKASTS